MSVNATTKRILLIAGETSGDRLGAHLVQAMRDIDPNIECFGFGGDCMKQAGVDVLMHSRDLAIVGFFEVIKKQKIIRRAFRTIRTILQNNPPDLVVLIDYPGFNLRISKHAKKAGIKVLYYTSPQIWAWKYGRIKTIRRTVDHMAVLFPFEEKIYQKENVPVTFVGHPISQKARPTLTKDDAYKHFQLDPSRPVIGLFPGSRDNEIRTLLPIIADALPLIQQHVPNAQWILPVAPNIDDSLIQSLLPQCVTLAHDHLYDLMNVCDTAIAVSGTITLELSLLQTPMTIIYKTHRLTYLLAKLLVRTKLIGLCNIIAEEEVARELIQHQATPTNIANETIKLLDNSDYRRQKLNKLSCIVSNLGSGVDSQATANIALNLITA
jgi:lipid-A-disaccharide synthase